MSRDRLPARAPLLVMAVLLLTLYHRLLAGEVFFWGLPALQFGPWREYALALLRDGHLPLWNPYNGAGVPLLANYQSALVYPASWAGLVLPVGFALSVTAVLHLFLAGWGMWMFTGRAGLPTLGRGVSALAFGLSSYLVARLGTFPIVTAAAWIPWLMWAVLGGVRWGRPRDSAWTALFSGLLLLAGHAQTAWYGLLLAALFALYEAARARPSRWYVRLATLAGGAALGAGIAAFQLLPTAELMSISQRANGVDTARAMNFSYAPARVLNLLSPDVFGNPGRGTYVTQGAFFEDAVYIGLIPLVAAAAAVIGWLRRRGSQASAAGCWGTVPLWVGVAAVAFVLALGDYTPVFPFLFEHVPTFNLFQAPVRWHIWTVFALSALAGIGTQAWGRGRWLFFWTRLATAGSLGAVALALLLAPRLLPADLYNMSGVVVLIDAVAYTGIVAAAAGALTLLQPDTGTVRHALWNLAVLAVVAADLGWAARDLNPTAPAVFYDRLAAHEERTNRAYWPAASADTVMFQKFLPFKDYRVALDNWQAFRASGLPNLNLLDRRALLNDFDPLLPSHHVAYVNLIESSAQPEALLRAAAVDGVYDESGLLRPLAQPALAAWFPVSLCWHADSTSLQTALADPAWVPELQAHLLGPGGCPQPAPDTSAPGSVERVYRSSSGTEVEIAVVTDTGGLLVLADTDYPGWTAAIDGQPTRILRVNGAFRAVEVPAGARLVRFEYRPAWLLPGAILSAAALLLTLLLFRVSDPNASRRQSSVE